MINRLAILVFAPSLIPDFFRQTAGKTGDGAVFSPSAATLAAFRERVFAPGDFSLLDVKGAIYLALGDFMKGATLRDSTKETELPGAIVGYINEHLTDAITLRDLARELGYHPNYLSGKIHEVFGLSLPSLIASIRADKAKYLLFETNKTGLEICYECGFGSERSFHRQFKAMTGRTPKEYRAGIHPGRIDRGVIKYF